MMLLCNFVIMLSDKSVLFIPHLSDKLLLQTDASSKGIGAVLSVVRDGQELPVGYFSKNLKKAEQNYAAIDHFAVHLLGCPFTIMTDHQALQYLQSSGLDPGGAHPPPL